MDIEEKELHELIATGKAIALDVWMDNCPYCDKYDPIFKSLESKFPNVIFKKFNLPRVSKGESTFKKDYMKPNSKGGVSAPATMLFSDGKLVACEYGYMDEANAYEFIKTGETKDDKKAKANKELFDLFARKGEIITLQEELPALNDKIKKLQEFLWLG